MLETLFYPLLRNEFDTVERLLDEAAVEYYAYRIIRDDLGYSIFSNVNMYVLRFRDIEQKILAQLILKDFKEFQDQDIVKLDEGFTPHLKTFNK